MRPAAKISAISPRRSAGLILEGEGSSIMGVYSGYSGAEGSSVIRSCADEFFQTSVQVAKVNNDRPANDRHRSFASRIFIPNESGHRTGRLRAASTTTDNSNARKILGPAR
jgi:hypothetical protein